MWLVHKPSGERALIAKSYGEGWYEYRPEADAPRSIEKLLDNVGADDNKDFYIEYESDPA
jgi:hypothetical protein